MPRIRTHKNKQQSPAKAAQPFFSKAHEGEAETPPFFLATPSVAPPGLQAETAEGDRKEQEELGGPAIQAKLTIGSPNDAFEQEADAVADKVIQRMDGSGATPAIQAEEGARPREEEDTLQRQIETEEKKKEVLQAKGAPEGEAPGSVQHGLEQTRGAGQPMPLSARESMEEAFGRDFSSVRLHTGDTAQGMNRELNAKAFTHGNDIYFNEGELDTEARQGRHLLAHELTHVAQQNGLQTSSMLFRQAPGPAPAPSPSQQAKQAIAAFRSRSGAQGFPKLDRGTVANELEQRVNDPRLINQSGLPLCGPAAFAFVWASQNMVAYVNFAINLFENGQGQLGSLTIAPKKDLKDKSPGSYTWTAGLTPAQADWMVLSSIRDSENSMIDFEGGPSEDTSGGTGEGDIIKWLRELGFSKVKDDVDRAFGDTVDDALKLNPSVGPDNYILLCVDAHMIDSTMKKKGRGNHWVVLRTPFTVNKGIVSFRVWTWGNYRDVSVSEETFNATYYGAIIATK